MRMDIARLVTCDAVFQAVQGTSPASMIEDLERQINAPKETRATSAH